MKEHEEIKIDPLGDWKRTHECGSLRADDDGKEAVLMGWVNSRRDLGNLIFIDLRDRDGITQIVFDPQVDEDSHARAHALRNEWVLAVKGTVSPRLKGQENFSMPTGAIELKVTGLKILNRTETPPFQVDGAVDASETLRLQYRYLELRRPQVFNAFLKRHRISACIRAFLNGKGFIEVETPFLTKSTPEGARDYLVPSRVNRGLFYALPQSPQLFKQLLMIGGFERYYQIVRCFRDEDLRADRQPEFTQVDLEMAFVNEDGVMAVFEEMVGKLFREIMDQDIPSPIRRMEFNETMDRFGTDRPDMRFGMELIDLTDIAGRSDFRVFRDVIEGGGVVKAITVKKGGPAFSRKMLDELSALAVEAGARGLAWIKVKEDGWQSSLKKFFNDEDKNGLNQKSGAGPGDLILIVAHKRRIANEALGVLRLEVARRMELIPANAYEFVWITKFPLLEYDETEKRLQAVHHPFTAPVEEDIPLLDDQPEKVRARAYDLVLNGTEIGGGSVRIHVPALQERMLGILGISPEQAQVKFGFLLEALKYGAPPHGGMALGFDRLVAIMVGVNSIREVIAFPKTTSATCLLTDAPSRVDEAQLKELGLRPDS
ncbi:MAG: aspartate--tRNA ligase [Deltaproteobacteria bacterium]|nr:aspartate--tRNA ligase [Deltaproteobacteria bacterium]MBW2116932.1 aspartate--tRNA ligase [Deltaproteobacteria bacterium]MBW2345349.1 aspartate--tRNA ligase [Deltaproteobacteria bacterium]